MSGDYLHLYAAEAAWRRDNNRLSNGAQFEQIISLMMNSGVSRQWKGYTTSTRSRGMAITAPLAANVIPMRAA